MKLFFDKTSFGETSFGKLYLATIWRRLATPIDSLASPGLTLATPGVFFFFKRLDRHTYIHTHAQLYYRFLEGEKYSNFKIEGLRVYTIDNANWLFCVSEVKIEMLKM